jgi:hypothetical protein
MREKRTNGATAVHFRVFRQRVGGQVSTTLSNFEQNELQAAERVIELGLKTALDVGRALAAIQGKKLYRATHKTFEAYCRRRWNIGAPRAYQLIAAGHTAENLLTMVHISGAKSPAKPRNERQIRALRRLAPAAQKRAWAEATRHNPRPTAREVAAAVARVQGTAPVTRAADSAVPAPAPSEEASAPADLAQALAKVRATVESARAGNDPRYAGLDMAALLAHLEAAQAILAGRASEGIPHEEAAETAVLPAPVEPPTVATTTASPLRELRDLRGEISPPADAAGRREKIRPKDSGGWRRWERRNGNAVEAILRAVTPTHIVVEKRDGARLRVPIDRLSDPDRAFLRERTRPAPIG